MLLDPYKPVPWETFVLIPTPGRRTKRRGSGAILLLLLFISVVVVVT